MKIYVITTGRDETTTIFTVFSDKSLAEKAMRYLEHAGAVNPCLDEYDTEYYKSEDFDFKEE